MKSLVFAILIPLALFAPAAEDHVLPDLSELIGHLSPAQRSELKEEGKLLAILKDEDSPTLIPGGEGWTLRSLRSRWKKLYGVETLLFLPVSYYADPDSLMLNIYNILRGVSSLEGADYYSISKKRRRTLFRQFYAISSVKSREALEDPIYDAIPRGEKFFVFQEDTTFGKAVHLMRFSSDSRSITLSMENIDPLKILIFTVAKPGELILLAKALPSKEGILFYGICQSEGGAVPGMEERIAQSLDNRVTAIFDWFVRRSRGRL